jgi:hypothetical protein
MSYIDDLLKAYSRFAQIPWDQTVAGPQRVWIVVYPPEQERRLRMRIREFEIATREADHAWQLIDLTDAFGQWLGAHDYREPYFESPADLSLALDDFAEHLADQVSAGLRADNAGDTTVVALMGLASLFGVARVSRLIEAVNSDICGRLLAFFPGELEGTNYRLLGARDGWNYLAIPITATEG